MPRPDFPRPYIPLPIEAIWRINEEQAHYDRDPERAEREQRRRQEALEEERREEEEQQNEQEQEQ